MPINIAQALRKAEDILRENHIESPQLDARVLMCHCIKRPETFLLAHPEHLLSEQETRLFFKLVQRRSTREPVAYITGKKEFWSGTFLCTPATLIPRPETELLIETALEFFKASGRTPKHILDLGTGTGCIGITLAASWTGATTVLTDIDPGALEVARKNIARLLNDNCRVHVVCSDWFGGISREFKFDLITANPPYVSREEIGLLPEDVIRFEPETALFSSSEGMSEIRRIFSRAHEYLRPGGVVLSEIGWQHGSSVSGYVQSLGFYNKAFVARDLSGHERVVAACI